METKVVLDLVEIIIEDKSKTQDLDSIREEDSWFQHQGCSHLRRSGKTGVTHRESLYHKNFPQGVTETRSRMDSKVTNDYVLVFYTCDRKGDDSVELLKDMVRNIDKTDKEGNYEQEFSMSCAAESLGWT